MNRHDEHFKKRTFMSQLYKGSLCGDNSDEDSNIGKFRVLLWMEKVVTQIYNTVLTDLK